MIMTTFVILAEIPLKWLGREHRRQLRKREEIRFSSRHDLLPHEVVKYFLIKDFVLIHFVLIHFKDWTKKI